MRRAFLRVWITVWATVTVLLVSLVIYATYEYEFRGAEMAFLMALTSAAIAYMAWDALTEKRPPHERLADAIIEHIQRRCTHPGEMVAIDLLEGCVAGLQVNYCRRCGAVRPIWTPEREWLSPIDWRRPDPHLWRG